MAEAQENSTFSICPGGIIKDSHKYKMNHEQRGKALIFVHSTYDPDLNLEYRKGTEAEANRLIETFMGLGFNVQPPYMNCTFQEIQNALNLVSQEDHRECDCLAVIVLTHGKSGVLFAYDTEYSDELLWSPFTADNSPSLIGKPKLFFIQACRGNLEDKGIYLEKLAPNAFLDQRRTPRGQIVDENYGPSLLQVENDFLVAYATVYDYVAWKRGGEVSWFIEKLCDELQSNSSSHLLEILRKVNANVAFECYARTKKREKQISCITHSLTQLLYFNDE